VQLVDSHCHLDDAQFDKDRDSVIERACAAGVKYMLAIGAGSGPPDLEAGIRMAEKYARVFATAGVHPNDAEKIGAGTFIDLERALRHPKIKGLGEIGLDYHWGVPKEKQIPLFITQLEIAARLRLPVVIHTRDAFADTMHVLRTHWATTGLPCIMHCFTGNAEQARECLDLGFYLAFGGVATFSKAGEIREAARITPRERLLLETDAPYLAPAPHRGKRNEPAYVAITAQAIAELRGVSTEELAAQTTGNFERLFQMEEASTSYTGEAVRHR
jgi:TatD DNase family protein